VDEHIPAPPPFKSDRWVTPGVIIAFLVVAGLLIALVVAATAWLTSIGRDPEPLVRLVASLVAAAAGLGTFVLNLAGRRTATKTERNTGVGFGSVRAELDEVKRGQQAMAEALWDVADALPRPPGAHAHPETLIARNHNMPPVPINGAAPASRGS
jgi:hypothetical protein